MACLKCPLVVAAGQLALAPEALEAEPALRLLCVDHFRGFIKDRDKQRIAVIREASRIFCECGNEKLFDRPGPCARCTVRPAPVVDVKAGEAVAIKIDPSWYRTSACQEQPCDAKVVFRLPDGRELCVPHGAPSKADNAGRS